MAAPKISDTLDTKTTRTITCFHQSKPYPVQVDDKTTIEEVKQFLKLPKNTSKKMYQIYNEGKLKSASQTMKDIGIKEGGFLTVRIEELEDIGLFAQHTESCGKSYLLLSQKELEKISKEEINNLIENIRKEKQEQQGSTHDEAESYLSTTTPKIIENCLNASECKNLIQVIQQAAIHNSNVDFQMNLNEEQLAEVISGKTVNKLKEIFGKDITDIRLRRVQAGIKEGQCIKFHLDVNTKTMQIALNTDTEFEGGRLVFVTKEKGFYTPTRGMGCGSVHDNTVVHGVTPLEKGTRYSLFFLSQ